MKRCSYLGPMLAIPVVVALVTLIPGCPSGKEKKDTTKMVEGPKEVKTPGDLGGGKVVKAEPFAVENTDAVIKGQVVYDGTPPAPAEIKAMKEHEDRNKCLAGPHVDTTWIVGKDGGVENVKQVLAHQWLAARQTQAE